MKPRKHTSQQPARSSQTIKHRNPAGRFKRPGARSQQPAPDNTTGSITDAIASPYTQISQAEADRRMSESNGPEGDGLE